MKNVVILKKTVLASAIASSIALLSACGGGSDSSTSTGESSTSGVITGFGSIYMNGVRYKTDGVNPSIDGQSGLETELGVGDVCEISISGTVDTATATGTATAVHCDDELEGYVLSNDLDLLTGEGTLNVMGQTITVNANTVFDSDGTIEITALAVNDIVEVSGFSDGLGQVVATRIELKNADEDVEVKGLVASLDAANSTFMLGSLKVDYSAAAEVPANLVDGLYIEAKTEAALTGDETVGFTMHASKVEIEDDGDKDIDGDEGDEIEMTGMVSNVTDTSFDFNGTTVSFASIELDDDFNLNTLMDGMIITVEGYIDASGQFVVTEIEDEPESEDEVKGTVQDITDSSITVLVDTETMVFVVDNETRMIDERDENVTPVHYFSLADMAIGDYVEVEYYNDESRGMVAVEVEREDEPL